MDVMCWDTPVSMTTAADSLIKWTNVKEGNIHRI